MNVASRELCQELYELLGWQEDGLGYWIEHHSGNFVAWNNTQVSEFQTRADKILFPAYDLGYLLRKLPADCPLVSDGEVWTLHHWDNNLQEVYIASDTPENAACKFAISLFKQNILKPEAKS